MSGPHASGLDPLRPALRVLEPLGFAPQTLDGWAAAVSRAQATRLAGHLDRELRHLDPARVDHAYLCSPAFAAHVAQVVRAAEIAESELKVQVLARALAGCVLTPEPPRVDRTQALRLLEALSDRETHVLAEVVGRHPLEPFAATLPLAPPLPTLELSQAEGAAALLGLGQLGLLCRVEGGWALTALARGVMTLTGLGGEDHLFR